MDLLKIAEAAFATGKEMPAFKSGDTVTISYKIIEGNKERIQQYRGVVIKIVGHGNKKRFTVRKVSENVGVERIFPFDSPFIEKVEVNKVGKVRRAKLYYLRDKIGKAAKVKTLVGGKIAAEIAARNARAAEAAAAKEAAATTTENNA
mgnify:CR=1 FL=1